MNLHPAYFPKPPSRKVLAMIASAFEATPHAWCLRLVMSKGVLSAWLPKRIISFQIAPGQVWLFEGETVDLEEFGEQFQIIDAVPTLPVDMLLIPFLAHHVPGLPQIRARRMWETLGEGLVEFLNQKDISTLAAAHAGPGARQIATMTVNIWSEQVVYTQLVKELYAYDFTQDIVHKFIGHHGQESLERLNDDPYRLLAFASLEVVDKAALGHFKMHVNDERRLIGIVNAAIYALRDCSIDIFSQNQLESAIQRMSSLRPSQAAMACILALKIGRLVETAERSLMGEDFSKIKRAVTEFLMSCSQSVATPIALANCTDNVSDSEVMRAASEASSARVSILLCRDEPTAFIFVKGITEILSSSNKQCYILAGSDALGQRIHAATGLPTKTLENVPEEGLGVASHLNTLRAIVIVSSIINFQSMKRLLPQLLQTDQIFFVGQPIQYASGRALLLPALMKIDQLFRRELSISAANHPLTAGTGLKSPTSSTIKIAYDPKASERCGMFWISVADQEFERAVVGVSHQLRRHGSVSIVAYDENDRLHYELLIDQALGASDLMVVTVDGIEPGDSKSSVVVLPEPGNDAWLQATLSTASDRVVIVSKVSGAATI